MLTINTAKSAMENNDFSFFNSMSSLIRYGSAFTILAKVVQQHGQIRGADDAGPGDVGERVLDCRSFAKTVQQYGQVRRAYLPASGDIPRKKVNRAVRFSRVRRQVHIFSIKNNTGNRVAQMPAFGND